MEEILAFIQTKKQEFAQLPLFEFLANKHIHPNQRLIFAPVLDPLAGGLSDVRIQVKNSSLRAKKYGNVMR